MKARTQRYGEVSLRVKDTSALKAVADLKNKGVDFVLWELHTHKYIPNITQQKYHMLRVK